MSKSTSGMVNRDTSQLITDTFPEAVAKIKFTQLHLVRQLLTGMNGNRYLTRASNGNVIFITATGDVHVASGVLFLVTILCLDLVMIQ